MSGIAGIFCRDENYKINYSIKKMNQSLLHRGPDGYNIYLDHRTALAHQMLHTTPQSLKEKQPFNEDNIVITADARIDNRESLLKILEIENHHISDSELILKAYNEWGEKCPDKLLGDFAFAIWDKNNEKLFCARDHMGVKPFYYYLSEDLFLFGSEIKAILTCSLVSPKINKMQVANYLGLYYEDREITSYENILRLPAAHSLTVTSQKKELKRYWALDPASRIYLDSDQEYIDEFTRIFTETVRCRLRSAYPVGAMLSGGLDSSSIVCTAQNILKKYRKRLNTFSAYFGSVPESNERYYIDRVLSTDEFDSHYINADEISPLAQLDEFFFHGDQFLIPPNHFLFWEIACEANSNGVRILLDGLEGDATLSYGAGLAAQFLKSGKLKKLVEEINYFSKRVGRSPYNILSSVILAYLTPKLINRLIWNYRELRGSYGSKTRIVDSNFTKKMGLLQKANKLHQREQADSPRSMHHRDITSGLYQYEMEFVDWATARFAVEPRHPFFDKRLIEFCFAIPTEQKRNKGWDRAILRRAMSGILPMEVQWRKEKGDLSHNFNQSLLKYEKELLDELILENIKIIEEYVDTQKIQEIYFEYSQGDAKDDIHLWNTVTLTAWLKKNSF